MRPHQWYKNLIIFIGIVFSQNLFNLEIWPKVIFAFVIFCLLSGAVYILNDVKDLERDRLHPRKRERPIASGRLPTKFALTFSLILIPALLYPSFILGFPFGLSALSYFILNIFYTFFLKNIPIVDLISIAVGFVLRAVAGAVIIDVRVSPWLVICTFLLAIVLAAGKRRHELIIIDNPPEHRESAKEYSVEYLEEILNVSSSSLIVSYLLYTFFTSYSMMLTLPFAIYGIFRYLQLVHIKNFGDSPEFILKDKASIINIVFWGISALIALYVVRP